MTMKRKTNFSVQEIINLLQSGQTKYPPCMLLNELGVILNQGEDKNQLAENYLLSLLNDKNENHRAISCFHLSYSKEVANRLSKEISEFRNNPENEDLVLFIDEELGV